MRGLPLGTYQLKETKAPTGYLLDTQIHEVVVSQGTTGIITTINNGANQLTVRNYPKDAYGALRVMKTVTGNGADTEMPFLFTISLEDADNQPLTEHFSYAGNGVSNGTLTHGSTIALAHAQSIYIQGLPEGTKYAVTETQHPDYISTASGAAGEILANESQIASFTNAKRQPRGGGLDKPEPVEPPSIVIPDPNPELTPEPGTTELPAENPTYLTPNEVPNPTKPGSSD